MLLRELINKYRKERADRRSYAHFLKCRTNIQLQDNINNLPRPAVSTLRILCNSANLREQLDALDDRADYMVVNSFVVDPSYARLKPKYYVIADALFFQSRREQIKRIYEDTQWQMALVVSNNDTAQYDWLLSTEHITVIKVNTDPYTGPVEYRDYCYDHNLAMPPVGNVLNMAIYVAIYLGYERVELYGVEHSWLNSMYVDDQNRLHRSDTHFYKEVKDKQDIILRHHNGQYTKLHEILGEYTVIFKTYWELHELAERHGCKIINCTPNSYIDAFERNIKK